ncbi:hypothetical protein, partial [Stenotrophomonas maltophilia]|uniref:hypothetical protein n=1 Tax=Stenotrophomonas maltophilia TaxID=40324 RepID=UPI0021C98879
MNGPKLGTEGRIGIARLGTLPTQVIMESRDRNPKNPTQQPGRVVSPLTGDEGVPHLDSLAKNAAAFFRISRSIFR